MTEATWWEIFYVMRYVHYDCYLDDKHDIDDSHCIDEAIWAMREGL